MDLSTWLLFSCIALVSVVSPGPAVLLAVTNGIRYGFVRSLYSSLGNVIGILIVSGAAIFGMGAILKTSAFLFTVLKICGALYLIYLGVRQWVSRHRLFEINPDISGAGRDNCSAFIKGFFVALSNPKAILFFTALFPQFVDLSKPVPMQFAVLTFTFMALSFLILAIYAKSAHAFKGWVMTGSRMTWFNRISGIIFVSFGLGILRIKNRAV